MEIKAAEVKALRDATGAGMMECKNALVECNGDAAEAAKLLKEKGLAAVEKRSGRSTSEGRIFIKSNGSKVAVVELTCETDFVAKNTDFLAVGEAIAQKVLDKGYTDVNAELSDMLLDLATKIRENMTVRRVSLTDIPSGAVYASYIHSDGKTGVVVILSCDPASAAQNESIKQFAFDCCLHIAAFAPRYLKREDVDAAYIAEQKEIFTAQTAELNKPDNVKAGIVQGKLNKHLADICFVDQMFVKDDKVSVAKKMEQVGKENAAKLDLLTVVNFQLGA